METTEIKFTKMHGLGNDFMLIDNSEQVLVLDKELIQAFSDRNTGVGFDQLLTITRKTADTYHCQIFNADGSEAEQCGNGLRCVARYLHEKGLIQNKLVSITTVSGKFPLKIYDYDRIEMQFPTTHINSQLIDIAVTDHKSIKTHVISLGNPHAIVTSDSMDCVLPDEAINKIQSHHLFPDGVNIGFVEVITPSHIRLRTIERGTGETNACGSNACASVVAGIMEGWLAKHVTVQFRLGALQVTWEGGKHPITVTGPAVKVYEGIISMCATRTSILNNRH